MRFKSSFEKTHRREEISLYQRRARDYRTQLALGWQLWALDRIHRARNADRACKPAHRNNGRCIRGRSVCNWSVP